MSAQNLLERLATAHNLVALAESHFPRARFRYVEGREHRSWYIVGRCTPMRVAAMASDIEESHGVDCEYDVERDGTSAVIWWRKVDARDANAKTAEREAKTGREWRERITAMLAAEGGEQ